MLDLVLAELRRSLRIYVRYPMELVGGMISMSISFYALFMGARYMAGPMNQFGDRLDGVVLGYWLWTIVLFALHTTASDLQGEAVAGTLEQVYLSPFGPLRVFMARAGVTLLINLTITSVMLSVMLFLTGRRLTLRPSLLPPLLTVLLCGYGFGLGLAGLALIYKRVGQIMSMSQFGLLFLVMLPIEAFGGSVRTLGMLLPITPGAMLLRDVMVRNGAFDWKDLMVATAGGAVYFGLGVGLFKVADRIARRKGVLGHY